MKEKLVVNLLGDPSFFWQGEMLNIPTRKATALLCYLAVCQGAVYREELSELLWGKPKSHAMRNELYRLRQLPGACFWLKEINNKIILNATSDLAKFEEAIFRGDFKQALEIYSGEANKALICSLKPKNTLGFLEWLETKREELNACLVNVLQERIEELEGAGMLVEAIELARQLLEYDPLDENTHRTIMRQEFRRGNLQKALKQYETCRYILAKELGITPLPTTLALGQEIEQASKKPIFIKSLSHTNLPLLRHFELL